MQNRGSEVKNAQKFSKRDKKGWLKEDSKKAILQTVIVIFYHNSTIFDTLIHNSTICDTLIRFLLLRALCSCLHVKILHEGDIYVIIYIVHI